VTRDSDRTFGIEVLVTVEEPSGPGAGEIGMKGIKAEMHLVVPVVNHAQRIVRHEDIRLRELRQRALHFRLLEEVVAVGFVFPRPARTSEGDAMNRMRPQMQIRDRRRNAALMSGLPLTARMRRQRQR
jgi:hypothetical protein